MAINVEDPQALKDVVDHARIEFEKSGVMLVNRATDLIRQVLSSTLADLFAGENNIIAALDGWSFTISPITIRLNKPKETN